MFVRVKKVGTYRYLQIAENHREGKRVKQTIIATLGRLDKLAASGAIDQLLRSAARFAERVMVLSEHSRDAHDRPDANVVSIGPALIFERLWRETGCQEVVRKLLATRHHHFDVERAVFMTVLHRLMVSGSDRSALQWRRDQAIDGTADLELQHLYRAMGWLGEALDEREPDASSPRRVKDLIEEELFARRRDLFTSLDLVFFDTTSLFFTGKGYKRYLKAEKGAFAVDLDKARDEERFDGMWVLRTNTELTAVEVALRYKQLWMVEQLFRTAKSLLDTRPIFHKTDATICGHVFCSFLALVLRDELFRRMDNAGVTAEWDDILRDLNALTETAITYNGKTFVVRSNAVGVAGKIAQCVGVRLPNTVRQVDVEKEVADPSP